MSKEKEEILVEENEIEVDDSDLVELLDEQGRRLKFFHVGSTNFANKWYAFFMNAEEIDGLDDNTVVIHEVVTDENGEEVFVPVYDDVLLEKVYEQFCREMEEEAEAAEAAEVDGEECCCGHHHHKGECDCHGEGHHHEGCECHGEGHHHKGECDCHGEGHHHEGCECHGEGKKGKCKKGE